MASKDTDTSENFLLSGEAKADLKKKKTNERGNMLFMLKRFVYDLRQNSMTLTIKLDMQENF